MSKLVVVVPRRLRLDHFHRLLKLVDCVPPARGCLCCLRPEMDPLSAVCPSQSQLLLDSLKCWVSLGLHSVSKLSEDVSTQSVANGFSTAVCQGVVPMGARGCALCLGAWQLEVSPAVCQGVVPLGALQIGGVASIAISSSLRVWTLATDNSAPQSGEAPPPFIGRLYLVPPRADTGTPVCRRRAHDVNPRGRFAGKSAEAAVQSPQRRHKTVNSRRRQSDLANLVNASGKDRGDDFISLVSTSSEFNVWI